MSDDTPSSTCLLVGSLVVTDPLVDSSLVADPFVDVLVVTDDRLRFVRRFEIGDI
jgi:hypothetical protein